MIDQSIGWPNYFWTYDTTLFARLQKSPHVARAVRQAFNPHDVLVRQVAVLHQISCMHRHAQSRSEVGTRWIQLGRLGDRKALRLEFGDKGSGPRRTVARDVVGDLLEIGDGAW
jgi:hypothetical protein